MSHKPADEFYVGYEPQAPPRLGKRLRIIAGGLVAAGLTVGALLMLGQPPFASSTFEYGIQRPYQGIIEEWPYPILRMGDASYLLVAPGKHGLSVKGLQGKMVRLEGTRIERGNDRMLEVIPASMREFPAPTPAPEQTVALGKVTLRGEIVDSKCYLGVMNPGSGKTHRDCAARCISGGAPPAFIARDASGETRVLLLTGSDGRPLSKEVLPFVAEPLAIPGELVRLGSNLVFKAEPRQFRRE
jgi:hypothetical protein